MAVARSRWEAFRWRERDRNRYDLRVQAIRCTTCHRLRAHPRFDDSRTWNCGCGGITFEPTAVHPDELDYAKRLYAQELEQRSPYSKVAQEILDEWRARHPIPGDTPERVRIYSK